MDDMFSAFGYGVFHDSDHDQLQEQILASLIFKTSEYLVPCKSYSQRNTGKFEMAAMVLPSGEKYLTAFTSTDEIQQWPYRYDRVVSMTYDDLKQHIHNNADDLSGIVIDLFSKRFLLGQELMTAIDLITDD
jgi:hypothetical protein